MEGMFEDDVDEMVAATPNSVTSEASFASTDTSPKCWLCLHSMHAVTRLVQSYVTENAGVVCPEIMSHEMSREIKKEFPGARGAEPAQCLIHLNNHSLTPAVRVSSMLRSLLELSDDMKKTLRSFDDDGNPVLDTKTIETYLKLQNQILTVYRQSETNRMLFSDRA